MKKDIHSSDYSNINGELKGILAIAQEIYETTGNDNWNEVDRMCSILNQSLIEISRLNKSELSEEIKEKIPAILATKKLSNYLTFGFCN